jgi:hypothetical protein
MWRHSKQGHSTQGHAKQGGDTVPRRKREEEELIEPVLLKVRETARLLAISERHVDALAAKGLLEKVYLDHAVRITKASAMRLAKAREAAE